MSTDNSHPRDAMDVALEALLREQANAQHVRHTGHPVVVTASEAHRRRLAADLAQLPMDEQAIDLAWEAFDSEYRRTFDPSYGDESSHCDAQMAGIAAAIKTYLTEAGR